MTYLSIICVFLSFGINDRICKYKEIAIQKKRNDKIFYIASCVLRIDIDYYVVQMYFNNYKHLPHAKVDANTYSSQNIHSYIH